MSSPTPENAQGGNISNSKKVGAPRSGRKSVTLKIDTGGLQISSPPSVPSSTRSIPSPSPAQDVHPYSRGAVIEVWHIPKRADNHDDDEWWWTESDDSETEEDIKKRKSRKTIRLCDIIDRSQVPNAEGKLEWKYYVHYRDFNRRMDEWVTLDRIVSPPSVGNAKARLLKREEEKLKRKRKEDMPIVDLSGPRTSRRRSSATPVAIEDGSGAVTPGSDQRNRRRLSRRKSMEDDDTVVAANTLDEEEEQDINEEKNKASNNTNKKAILSVATDGVTMHTVAGHVLATLNAVELDEHEGLDEHSLREHEEVTKVKNVNFLELGEFQMETWYFSPLPRELIGHSGFLEVLYACEFTLNMFARKSELLRYQSRLPIEKRHPPGMKMRFMSVKTLVNYALRSLTHPV